MEFRAYVSLARRWLWLPLLAMVLAGFVGFAVSRRLQPVYESSLTLLVRQGSSGSVPDYNGLLADERLAQTDAQLLKGPAVLDEVIAQLHLTTTADALLKSIDARVVVNTQLLAVTARAPEPSQAAEIANMLAQVFIKQNEDREKGRAAPSTSYLQTQLSSLASQIDESERRIGQLQAAAPQPTPAPAPPSGLAASAEPTRPPNTATDQASIAADQTRLANLVAEQAKLSNLQTNYSTILRNLQDIRFTEASLPGSVSVIQSATPASKPVSPNVKLNVALSALVGLLAAIGCIGLAEYLDNRLDSAERVRKVVALPTIGLLPRLNAKARDMPHMVAEPEGDAYRTLAAKLDLAGLDHPWGSLLVTSAGALEGKTTVASRLAIMLASAGRRVIVVDLNLQHPGLHHAFHVEDAVGISDLLTNAALKAVDCLVPTDFENVRVLSAGSRPADIAGVGGFARLPQILKQLQTKADAVLLDSAPVLLFADPTIVARHVVTVLLVVDAQKTRAPQLRETVEALTRAGAHIAGVTLNRTTAPQHCAYPAPCSKGAKSVAGHAPAAPRAAAQRHTSG